MWLGGEEPRIEQGVPETVKKLALVRKRLQEIIGPGNEDLVIDRCQVFDICDPKAYEQLGLEPVDLVDLIGWYLLFSRSWFKRAWVVQEWVLSPTCLFLCGTTMFSTELVFGMFNTFVRRHWTLQIQKLVIANLSDPETMTIPDGLRQFDSDDRDFPLTYKYRVLPLFRAKLDDSIFTELDESLLAVSSLRHFFTDERSKTPPRDPSSQDLWNISLSIQQFRSRRCSNPRDKIYAFHGIFKNSDGMSIFPSPDYLKPVSEVYIEATRAIALDIGNSFLHFREFRSSNPHGLPSWVPNYQENDGLLRLDNPWITSKDPFSFFTAAAGLGTSTLVFKEDHKLGLVGCHVDTVIRPEPFQPEIGTMGSDCKHLLETLRQIPEKSLIPMPPPDVLRCPPGSVTSEATKQSRYEVLWRTLVRDKRNDHVSRHPAPSEIGDVLMGRLKGLLKSQCGYIVAKDIMELLEYMRQEPTKCDESQQFFANYSPFLEYRVNMYQSWIIPDIKAPDSEYDRRTQVDGLFEMNAVIEILQENLPIESEERQSPKVWT
ncbi:AAA family ATPase [Colletotrichum kahawae]|uniref:AAA family ATPase n=1 Tax=Colletotrichum kahawae TaxID=34407 RepID=A0AAD9Y9F2_COLKA|nr:AAA family ATPase [Colletotrichum kahawae]